MSSQLDVHRDPTFLGGLRQAGYLQPLDVKPDSIERRFTKRLDDIDFRDKLDVFLNRADSIHYGELSVLQDDGYLTVVVPVKPLPRRRGFTTDDDSWTPTDEPSDRYQPSITFELTGRSHFPITVRFVHSTPHDVYLPPSFSEYAVSKPTVDHTLIKAGVPPIVLDGGKFWVSRESIGVFAHGDWAYKVYALDGKWDAAHRSWEAAQTMGLPMLKSAWETSGWSLRTGGKTKAVVFFKARLVEGKKFFALSQNTAHVWGQFVKEQKTVGPLGELLEGMCLAHAVGLSDAQGFLGSSLPTQRRPHILAFMDVHSTAGRSDPNVTAAVQAVVHRLRAVDPKWKDKIGAETTRVIKRTFPGGLPGDVAAPAPAASSSRPRSGSVSAPRSSSPPPRSASPPPKASASASKGKGRR